MIGAFPVFFFSPFSFLGAGGRKERRLPSLSSFPFFQRRLPLGVLTPFFFSFSFVYQGLMKIMRDLCDPPPFPFSCKIVVSVNLFQRISVIFSFIPPFPLFSSFVSKQKIKNSFNSFLPLLLFLLSCENDFYGHTNLLPFFFSFFVSSGLEPGI